MGIKDEADATAQAVETEAVPDMRDAYVGAREDLAIWKRRALEAERQLRAAPAPAAVEVPDDVAKLMGLADAYAGAEASAVTATSTADGDTTQERNALQDALRAALAATQPAAQGMEKDAARYRWLRKSPNPACDIGLAKHFSCGRGEDFEALIDAAIAASAAKGGEA